MSPSKPSPASGSGSEPRKVDDSQMVGSQNPSPAAEVISSLIDTLKQQVAADRCDYIKKRVAENRLKLEDSCNQLLKLSNERKSNAVRGDMASADLLTKRFNDAIITQNGIDLSSGKQDSNSSQEDSYSSSAILLGSTIAVKNDVHQIMLPQVKRLPALYYLDLLG